MGVQIPRGWGNFEGCLPLRSIIILCCSVCKNGWTHRDAVLGWFMWAQGTMLDGSRTNPFAAARGDNVATRPFIEILWLLVTIIIVQLLLPSPIRRGVMSCCRSVSVMALFPSMCVFVCVCVCRRTWDAILLSLKLISESPCSLLPWRQYLSSVALSVPYWLSVGSSLTLGERIQRHEVTDNGMILFAAYTATQTLSASQWPGQPSKLSFVVGISTPSNTWFLEPTPVTHPNGISIGSTAF